MNSVVSYIMLLLLGQSFILCLLLLGQSKAAETEVNVRNGSEVEPLIESSLHNDLTNSFNNTMGKSTKSLQLVLLKSETEIQARTLTFPRDYVGSHAIGIFQVVGSDYPHVVFCKNRGKAESQIQVAGANFGRFFERHFHRGVTAVAWCERLNQPELKDLPVGSAGAKMWNLLYDNGSSFRRSSSKRWLLEEPVRYYNPLVARTLSLPTAGTDDVDASLRQKLRMAAHRSRTGAIDLVDLFMLTEFSQSLVQGPDPKKSKRYQATHALDPENLHLALTAAETIHLFKEKLVGPEVQIAMLFTILMAPPDSHCGNLVVYEVEVTGKEKGLWRLGISHFDLGLTSVPAGVSLESWKLAWDKGKDGVDYSNDFDFNGGSGGKAYYYPVLFSSMFALASEPPLDTQVRKGLLSINSVKWKELVKEQLDGARDNPTFAEDMSVIFQKRLEQVQQHAEQNPECSCRDLAFATVTAWKRDFDSGEKHSFVDWLMDIQDWAITSTEKREKS